MKGIPLHIMVKSHTSQVAIQDGAHPGMKLPSNSLDFISGVFFIVLTDFLFSALNIFNTGIMKGCCVQLASKLLIAFHNELTALDKLVIRSFRTDQSFRSFL